MMTRYRNILAVLALAVPLSANAFAAPDDKAQQTGRNCEVHKPATDDCHVHDERTYQHMLLEDRKKMSQHAQREMREHMRREQQERRN